MESREPGPQAGASIIAPLLMWLGYETKRATATTAYVVTVKLVI